MSPNILVLSGPVVSLPEINPWIALAMAVFLVLLNGFFVAAEFALVKIRPTQLDPYVARGDRRGELARHMVRHLDAYLSASQLGITLASLALGWIGEPAFAWIIRPVVMRFSGATPALIHSLSLTLAFLTITVLHIVLGELAPKSIAIRRPEPTTLWVSIPFFLFSKITYPIIWLLNHAANGTLRLVGIRPVLESELAHDEEEMRLILASSSTRHLSAQKKELLDNVFELSNRIARQIMVPRTDVVYLSTTRSIEENLHLARTSGHTRFPLCKGDLDQVVGLVHIKDIFRADREPKTLAELRREIGFVPETLTLDRLLKRMLVEQLHLAAVLDEHGGVSGIVSLENVIEEIVGEIQDEFDREGPEIVRLADNDYEVSGAMLVADLEAVLAIEFSDRDEDTIAGVILSELGRPPATGDQVEVGPLSARVTEVEGNRATRLRVRVLVPDSEEPG